MKIDGLLGALIIVALGFIAWKKGLFDGLLPKTNVLPDKTPDVTVVPSAYVPPHAGTAAILVPGFAVKHPASVAPYNQMTSIF